MTLQADTRTLESRTFVDQEFLMYQAALNRAPEEGGLDFWTDLRQAGGSELAVAQNIVGSAEYASLHAGESLPQQVTDFYVDLFGRAPDPTGLMFWTSGHFTPAGILLGLANSAEAQSTNALAIRGFEATVERGTLPNFIVSARDYIDGNPFDGPGSPGSPGTPGTPGTPGNTIADSFNFDITVNTTVTQATPGPGPMAGDHHDAGKPSDDAAITALYAAGEADHAGSASHTEQLAHVPAHHDVL